MGSDPFLSEPKKKRKQRKVAEDEEIDSDEFDSDNESNKKRKQVEDDLDLQSEDEQNKEESKTEKRRRLAKQYLEDLKQENMLPSNNRESNYGDEVDTKQLTDYTFDAKDLDDDIIARRLQFDVTQQKGNIYKFISKQLQLSKKKIINTVTDSYLMNPTCLCVNYPFLYVVSKEQKLVKYEITNLTIAPKKVKYVYMKSKSDDKNGEPMYHSDEITCVAVSSNGKFVVTGGKDKHILIWDTSNLTLLKKIPLNHKNAVVNAIAFRKGTNEIYVASNDLKIRIYNVNQFSLIDTLFGHQDSIVDISALNQERCVTVGLRDRSAMYWKIPEQTRLTFNSSISFDKYYNQFLKENKGSVMNNSDTKAAMAKDYIQEGSLECVSMCDNRYFVTGSDNGNISFWTIQKKKPLYTMFQAHGLVPELTLEQYTGDKEYMEDVAGLNDKRAHVPPRQAYWITAIHAIPYTDVFITGSWSGELKVWQLDETLKKFTLLYKLNGVKGVVSSIAAVEVDKFENTNTGKVEKVIAIFASVSKEHKTGRWLKKPAGAKNSIYQAFIKVKSD
ncbi:Rrp9 protein [Saccharomycopsis crataegensis]|uniref:Rrp9 protein n=1 Tax=Saccharomycopsis crataegensis TaxID=43959 RepID=A0AAV5QWC2_9ASCO|nr:Rrp9 protein [Saccharomycopsis crataegensis]